MMDISISTVKSWERKGFKVMPDSVQGKANLTVNNALELMLTIHLTRCGIDAKDAHEAAVTFARFGDDERGAGGLYPNSNTLLLLPFDGSPYVSSLSNHVQHWAYVPFSGVVVEISDLVEDWKLLLEETT